MWKKNKGGCRVLFVKDNTVNTDRTIIKTLPKLPDEEESRVDEDNSSSGNIKDYGLEITHTPSISKSAH